jgi:CheY-like chemotaxis protein
MLPPVIEIVSASFVIERAPGFSLYPEGNAMENQHLPTAPFQRAGTVILLVDEDASLREMLCMVLGSEPSYSVSAAATAIDALQFLHVFRPDLVIIDYELSSSTGLYFYDQLHQKNAFPPIPGILLSAPLVSDELESRPLWIVQEPFDLDTLLAAVKQAALWREAQSAGQSCHTPRERNTTMKTKAASFFSTARILSWRFVYGLMMALVSGLLLLWLIVRSRSRRRPQRPLAPSQLLREHTVVVQISGIEEILISPFGTTLVSPIQRMPLPPRLNWMNGWLICAQKGQPSQGMDSLVPQDTTSDGLCAW